MELNRMKLLRDGFLNIKKNRLTIKNLAATMWLFKIFDKYYFETFK